MVFVILQLSMGSQVADIFCDFSFRYLYDILNGRHGNVNKSLWALTSDPSRERSNRVSYLSYYSSTNRD